MLVEPATPRRAIDEDDLRKRFVGIARATAAYSVQPVEKIADREDLLLNGGIRPILEVREEDTVVVVVQPAHIGLIHRSENGGRRIQRMAGIVRVFMAERTASHKVHAIWYRVGQNR